MIDIPPQPIDAAAQVIEQKLAGCGLSAEGLTVKYEDYLQGFDIVVAKGAGAKTEMLDCIHQAVGYENITFEDERVDAAYRSYVAEKLRPGIVASAKNTLAEKGLLDGLPLRDDYDDLSVFGEALEIHCGAEKGSIFSVSGDALMIGGDKPDFSQSHLDKLACLLAALTLSGETKFGFLGNEKIRDDESN